LLRPFEITHDSVRIGDETLKGYMRSDFEDAFGRYLPATPATRNDPNDLTENSERNKEGVTSLNPPTSGWGRSMHAKRGGLAVQRKYWLEGRHPTEPAIRARLSKEEEEESRATVRRVWHAKCRPSAIGLIAAS
jgi:hypothetical protein